MFLANERFITADRGGSESGPDICGHGRLAEVNMNTFSVRSAYELIRGVGLTGAWPGWKRIWRLKVQERIKVFLWLLAHEKVLTNLSRVRRNLSQSACCDRCPAAVEDAMHAVRDCPASKEVWIRFVPPDVHNQFFSFGVQDWLLTNISSGSHPSRGERWPANMAIACWKLWKWRYDEVLTQRRRSVDQKIVDLRLIFREMELAFEAGSVYRVRKERISVLGES